MGLDTPLSSVKGVGPKNTNNLARANLLTIRDILYFFPRKYEDYSKLSNISSIQPGKVTLRGYFENVRTHRVRRNMSITEATLVDATGRVSVVWFNQSYRRQQISDKKEFLVSGEFGLQYRKYQVISPSVESIDGDSISAGRIVPVYRQIAGLKAQLVRKVTTELRPFILSLGETLPLEIVASEKLMSRADAIGAIHFPQDAHELDRARERLGFEELLALMTASLQNRADNEALESYAVRFDAKETQSFVSKLPFELTKSQRIASWEIIQNLNRNKPMNRILQGDVGSGKTVVAGLVAHVVASNGLQTAIMAPTELLALQHAETLRGLLSSFGVSIGLLTGSVKGKKRELLYKSIASGDTQIVIGTHALIQGALKFHQLGFVVIDEQHRFGVEQRQKLLVKSGKMPHLLAMTATPIPRSLQLTVYGELDISVLNEKPKDRLPIKTKIISPNSRAQMYDLIVQELEAGRQAYVVCPRIDEVDDEQKSVEAEIKRLRQGPFRHRKIGLLHGKMKSDEKNQAMKDFANKKTEILVSTTVVEVGVDVPNSTVMVIEGADTFGLAQLHQLRGRVGRSDAQSYCFLVPSTSLQPSRRLRELEKSNDGFYLAEKDLELRGPGEIYGRAQHGELNLQVADIGNTRLTRRVKKSAEWLVSHPQALANSKLLLEEINRYRRLTTLN